MEQNRDFDVKVTKRILLNAWNNCMSSGREYHIKGRILNASGTKYRPFSFVVSFEYWEVAEHFETEKPLTEAQIREYLEEMIFCHVDTIKGYNDTKAFYELCAETIARYNARVQAAA